MENTTSRLLVLEIFEGVPGEIGIGRALNKIGYIDTNDIDALESCVHEYLSRHGMTYEILFEGSTYGDVSMTVRLDNDEEYSYTTLV